MIGAATWKIIGTAALIFTAGMVTGSFASHSLRGPRREPPAPSAPQIPEVRGTAGNPTAPVPVPTAARRAERPSSRPPGWQRLEALRRLEQQISLTKEQRERIQALIRESEQRIRSDWEPVVPGIQTEIRELRRRIAAELDPVQRQKFEALFERREGSRRTNAPPESLR